MTYTKSQSALFWIPGLVLVAAVLFAWGLGVRQDAEGTVKCLTHYRIVDTVLETHVGHAQHCKGFTRTGWTGIDSAGVKRTGTLCNSNWFAPSETLIVTP